MKKENHIMKKSKDPTLQNTVYVLPPIKKNMLLCNIFLNTKLTKFRIFKMYDSINAKQVAFSSCTRNCCQATNVYRKRIFMFFIPYANNPQLKAEGDLAALKHWCIYIQGVPGGMCQTSGGCSLC